MEDRGWNHKTPVGFWENIEMENRLGDKIFGHKIDRYEAFKELISRCPECLSRIQKLKEESCLVFQNKI